VASRVVDVGLVLLLGLMGALWFAAAWQARSPVAAVVGVVVPIVGVIVAGLRRRNDPRPLYVALVVAAVLIGWAAGSPAWFELGLVGLFVVLAYEPDPRARRWGGLGLAAALVGAALFAESWAERVEALVLVAAVAGWGVGVRASMLYRESLVQRAADAERERDLRAAQAVAQERARIARDIHDVVSHSLAVVVVQASGGQRAAAKHPELAADALGVIADTARGALTEMRALLQVLREGDAPTGPDQPAPGLPQVTELTGEFSTRGLPVATEMLGDPYPLGAGAELALYRVAQEALTNALKHGARQVPASLSLAYGPEEVTLDVVNRLAPAGEGADRTVVPGSGVGQEGMRERLALYGGSLTAGPEGSDYRVRATIPRPAAGAAGAGGAGERGERSHG
jgi:signal transduction histidine kinase